MCGLVGVAGKELDKKDSQAFSNMLELDMVRGYDSTGVLVVRGVKSENPRLELAKEVGIPYFLMTSRQDLFGREGRVDHINTNVLMGHNRAATQGAVNKDSAHPFDFPNVVGAHNGTVPLWSLRNLHEERKYNIDSQIIFSHISHTDNVQDVWDAGGEGALTLTWWDKNKKLMNFATNGQRTFWITTDVDEKKFYWASEKWMFAAAYRLGIKLAQPIELGHNLHLQVDVSEEKVKMEGTELRPFVKKIVPLKKWETHTSARSSNNGDGGSNVISLTGSNLFDAEFYTTEFVALTNDEGGKPTTGYMWAKTWDDEDVKIVGQVSEFLQDNGEPKHDVYRSKFCFTSWCDSKKAEVITTDVLDCVPVWDEDGKETSGVAAHLPDGVYNHNGKDVGASEWIKKTNGGCHACFTFPRLVDAPDLKWLSDGVFLCGTCKEAS
jgi:hypothetical protein